MHGKSFTWSLATLNLRTTVCTRRARATCTGAIVRRFAIPSRQLQAIPYAAAQGHPRSRLRTVIVGTTSAPQSVALINTNKIRRYKIKSISVSPPFTM